MKNLFTILALAVCFCVKAQTDPAYPPVPAAAQNIITAEYFIDTDPGFGHGTPLTLTPGLNIANLTKTINTAGLANGVHRLYIRSKNQGGRWSLANYNLFTVDFDPSYPAPPAAAQNIVAAEYFIDTDPGFGKGTAITITPGLNIASFNTTVNTTGLGNGVHRLYLRTKNAVGKWSLVNYSSFIVNSDPSYPTAPAAAKNIIAAEYFIDIDPGFGNGTAITVTPGLNISNMSASINTTGLSNGVHRLYMRTLNAEGRWSLTGFNRFEVSSDPAYPASPAAAQNIVSAEYFIDNDPGFGNGIAITVTPGLNISNINVSVNTTGLSNGVHRVYVRTLNAEGRWGLTNLSSFEVASDPAYPVAPAAAQNILAAEYFIDNDPGFGKGHAIAVTPGKDIANVQSTVNTSQLSNGKHYLYVRTLSQEGRWSLSNVDTFYTDLLSLSADTIAFGNVVTGNTSVQNLYIINHSASPQTINNLSLNGPFSANITAPFTIPANGKDTIQLTFAPTLKGNFTDSIVMNTASGHYRSVLTGSATLPVVTWAISPATGHDYGTVAVNTAGSYTFGIINTGNTAITLANITASDAAFTPVFTAGTIPAGSTSTFTVTFTPTNAAAYMAQLKIISSSPGVADVITQLSGTGYVPGAPPALSYVASAPYNSISGVNPQVSQAGSFTYKVLYKSANNLPPQAGYPQVAIDLNGDQNFGGSGEGVFAMVKEGSGTNYKNGVAYSYVYKHNNNTSTAGYRFFATDANGNSTSTTYKSGPTVTDDRLDLRIFANNIAFSDANPQPGETFTLTATVSNNTAIAATNVPVQFYRDTIPLASDVIPYIGPKSSGVITHDFTFSAEGFYPIKVWVDSSNTTGDINPLNNYAIRPVIVGAPNLPGGINVITSASIQNCPQQQVNISGNAVYYGTSGNSVVAVAGATVTITTGSQTIMTTTDVNGNYAYGLTNVGCGGNFEYNVVVTDYTFTSKPATNVFPLPCPDKYACVQPDTSTEITPPEYPECPPKVGDTLRFTWSIKYRKPDPANFWGGYDYIANSVLNCYINDTLVKVAHDSTAIPGKNVNLEPLIYVIRDTTPIKFTASGSYIYMERQSGDPSDFKSTNYTLTGYDMYYPEPKLPDIEIQAFEQTGANAFQFYDVNTVCGLDVSAHRVVIYDSLPNGKWQELRSETVPYLHDVEGYLIRYNDLLLAPGKHRIKIVTDIDKDIKERKEDNNTYYGTIKVPATDLAVENISVTPTSLDSGSTVVIRARIKNTGKACGSFKIQFALDSNRIGRLIEVPGVNEKYFIDVQSDPFILNSAINSCGGMITVQADVFTEIFEVNLANNIDTAWLSADLVADQVPGETGSAGNPAVVRVNTTNIFNPLIRNNGLRDAGNLLVRYSLGDSLIIGIEGLAEVKPAPYATVGSFSYMFTQPGLYGVTVWVDTAKVVCETNESNNKGTFYIRVTDSKPDFEVLSQYISPGSLNPNVNQNITLVGTVRNSGGKPTNANRLKFLVDDIQVGTTIPINALQPGKDTTVLATATYSSSIAGTKIIRLVADPDNTLDEEREDNNEATRAIIVGDAPNMAKQNNNAISLNPATFNRGDSVLVSYAITNKGTQDGAAWVRFTIFDKNGSVIALDSVSFSLTAGSNLTVSKKMFFSASQGSVMAGIVNCTPEEYDLLDNSETLNYTASNQSTFYADNDQDGFGDPNKSITASAPPPGYVADNTDCNDADNTIYPHAPELCDGKDNDCDGKVDEDGGVTWYRDADGDGFGDASVFRKACTQPAGYVTDNTDCDDTKQLYADNDGDGFGAGSPAACGVANNTDCDDNNAGVHQSHTYYADNDGDGFGDASNFINECSATPPAGYVTDNTDCDDNNAAVNPATTWYKDADNDGYSDGNTKTQCSKPSGYKRATALLATSGDCDDNNAAVHPNATEICGNGIDDNCNGQVDEGCYLPITVSIADTAVKEGNGGKTDMLFKVSLSEPATTACSVQYKTQTYTAIIYFDFVSTQGTLSFAPGEQTKYITVKIVGDRYWEPNEKVKLVLSNPLNTTISGSPVAVGTIINDDAFHIPRRPWVTNFNSDSGNAKVIELPALVIPNLLHHYDQWNIKGLPQQNNVIVADMNGKILFNQKNYQNNRAFAGWTSGMYYYHISFINNEGKEEVYKGKLVLVD
ncbi:CARDB domain-containing protein [Parafilimonas sp.]|uniref:CARDB domain-containing protein n=1 Tax=Parafilimonas sp. TaxID=1969739 RepID=UPI003F7E56A2